MPGALSPAESRFDLAPVAGCTAVVASGVDHKPSVRAANR